MRTTPRILIVDDDVDNCTNLADIFADVGYATDVAYDGDAAMARLQQSSYDIAILDFKMPDMDGVALYEAIRQSHPQTVAFMVTADSGNDGSDRALDAGMRQVLSKPVDVPWLLMLMETALGQPL